MIVISILLGVWGLNILVRMLAPLYSDLKLMVCEACSFIATVNALFNALCLFCFPGQIFRIAGGAYTLPDTAPHYSGHR